MSRCAGSQATACFSEQLGAVDKHDVSVRRLHIGQVVTSVVSFQIRGRPVTDIRFAFETLQNGHDAKTFGFATEGPSLTGQECAEECDNNVLMAYGRCLRPALYSSLRSSPSHPTGVSALRVTIAIANARKQSGLRKSTAKTRRHFRNESAASRRVRADAIGGSTAMTRTAFSRKSPRVPRVCLGSRAPGTSDRENTTAGRRDKRGSPVEPQAIDMAWVPACRSVGVRAAPKIFTRRFKHVLGTVGAGAIFGARS